MSALEERATALKAARERVARAQAKIDRETAEIASAVKGTREVSKVAAILGLSRQRLYQVAA